MQLLQYAARWEMILLIAAFGFVTLWKLFQSADFTGLLRSEDGTLSPGRIQLLVMTVLTAMQYLLATMHDPSHLHPIPASLVTVMGGSQAVYLATKAWSIFGPKQNKQEDKQ